jgi:gliding motility-associated-like protein
MYSVVVYDQTYPGCPPSIFNVPVTTTPVPVVNAGNNVTICANNPSVQLNGFVANATGGVWSGGTGTFSSTTALNATYTASASEIASGSVTLTLTSTGNGTCFPVSDQVTISIVPAMSVSIQPPIICFGQTGTLTAAVTGGTAPYTYLWSTGATTQTISNVSPGAYSVTVTDATQNACVVTQSVNVTQNPQIVINVPSSNVISCNATALVSITASGGNGSYTYMWNTGATTTSINVPAGNYVITATDAVGCTGSATISVTAASSSLSASINQPPNLCFGATTTITATPSGGFGGYTYLWSTGQTTASITTGAGSRCVTVTDAGGCMYSACVTITQSPQLTLSASTPSLICNGSTGTITTSLSGGMAPYTFMWSTGATTPSITQTAGTYSVTVTDNNTPGCTATATATITQAPPIVLTGSSTPVSCFGASNGSAGVSVSGGVGPYSYFWPVNNSTANTVYGLPAGTYQVTVTDAIGCSQTISVSVTQPTQLNAVITSVNNVSCFGGNNGSAAVSVSGGTPGYSYSWSPVGGTTPTATNLTAGGYIVTVTDIKGCIRTATASITQPPQLTVAPVSITNVSCYNGNNGSATVSANGGTGTLSYYWIETGTTGATATGLFTGTYNALVTDASGCTATTSVFINQPSQLQSSVTSMTQPSCNGGSNGSVTVSASGGTPGYTYYWPSLNTSGATVTGLSAGIYNYTVTDNNGCTLSSALNVTQPSTLLFLSATGSNVSCFGACNGTASVTPGGGVTPYTYQWNTSQTTQSISGLCPGSYSVSVIDNNGCVKDTLLSITQPAQLSLFTSSSPAICNHPNGSASVNVSGGSTPYAYSWNSSPIQTTATALNLVPGTYTVNVTDNNSCTQTAWVTVGNTAGVSASLQSVSNMSCSNTCNGSATMTGIGGAGPYVYSWSTFPVQATATASNLCSGTYLGIITDNNGCSDTVVANITAPLPVALSVTPVTGAICIGQSATLTVTASGGSGTYNFNWNNGTFYGPSWTVYPTTTTTYTVVAIDNSGCISSQQTITVSVNPPLTAIVAPGINVCQGNTAYLTASATGGNGLYSFTWYPGGSTGNIIGVIPTASTSYTVQVTDACGTPADTAVIPVTVNPNPAVNFSANISSGCAPLCVTFNNSTTISSGSITNWLWDFGDNTPGDTSSNPQHCFGNSGSYDVSLTAISSQGCSVTYMFFDFVGVLPTPVAEFSFNPETATIFNSTIQFTELAQGESSWWWSFGDPNDTAAAYSQNPTHTFVDSGLYAVTLIVGNAFQCYDQVTHYIRVQPEFTFYIPNAFTPNGNGLNEFFTGEGINIKEYKMMIFDRWGNLIFETEDLNIPWDGKARGGQEIAQEDVYVYVIDLVDIFGNEHKYRGHVTLIK